MAHAWKACWVQALGGSNPPSSATGPRNLPRFRGFCCLWRRWCCLWCRWCSGRRRARPPARSPHAGLRLGVVDLEARPCPPGPPAPSTPAALVSLELARSGPAPAHRHRGQTLRALRRPPHRRHLWCCVPRPAIGRSRAAEPRPRPLRLRGPRRSLRPGARPGPRPSRTVSSGEGPSRCSSIRPSMPSR